MGAAPKRLLLVTQHFQPTRSSGGRLLSQLMPALVSDDLKVEVLTSNLVGGEPRETWRGVHITRLAHSDKRHGILMRGLIEGWFAAKTATKLVAWPKPDIAILHSSPPFLPYLLGPICRARGVPYLYIMYDLYPDILQFMGKMKPSSPVYRLWDRVSRGALRHAAAVILEGRCVAAHVRAKFADEPENIEIVHNWSEKDVIYPLAKAENHFYKTGVVRAYQFVVQYAGNIGRIQDFDVILGAAERLAAHQDVVFFIVGEGNHAATLDAEIARRGLGNIVRLPYQDEALKNDLLNAADVSLVTLLPDMEKIGVPSKIYPTLAAGVPVLSVMDPSSEAARILAENNIGWNTTDRTGAALAEKILDVKSGACRFADVRQVYVDKFDFTAAVARYKSIIAGLLAKAGR